MKEREIRTGLEILASEFGEERVKRAVEFVKNFKVEVPSWHFGAFGGGRFGNYMYPGAARNVFEKIDDAAFVAEITGAVQSLAVHALWDFSKDEINIDPTLVEQVVEYARSKNIPVGSVSPTYFLTGSEKGSLSAYDENIRQRYIRHTIEAAEIAQKYGGKLLTLWLPDGSIYPGQISLRKNYLYLKDSLNQIKNNIHPSLKVLIEYKVFEPGTYSTTIPDWGTAFALARDLGENFGVLVDLGHHAWGINIEQIIARLIAENIPGGLHLNTRYAADDDHAVQPDGLLARIFFELVDGGAIQPAGVDWPMMIDQASSRENRMQAIIHSIDSLQVALARATLIDAEFLGALQAKDDIIGANRYFNSAIFLADVRPIVYTARLEKNLPIDPIQHFNASNYQNKINAQRKG